METLAPEGASYRRHAYLTIKVKEIGESGKLFVEPAGVTDGATVSVYVPEGVVTPDGGGGCCTTELAPLPPPQLFSTIARKASAATLFQSSAVTETFPRSRLRG